MATSPSSPQLNLTTDRTPTGATVRCAGRITSQTAEGLKTTVKPLLSQGTTVQLDCADVSYMDSSGLGAVVGLYASAKGASCQFKLVNLNQRLTELLTITHLNELIG